jgi:hypothetical protein
MALIDVSPRCKAMSGLGATADIGRRCGLNGLVAFDPGCVKTLPTVASAQQKKRISRRGDSFVRRRHSV